MTPPCLEDLWKESGVALIIPITKGRVFLPPSNTAMYECVCAAGFMTCGDTGVVMSEEIGLSDDGSHGPSSEEIMMPSDENLSFAESIFTRLNPPTISAIPSMIHTKAKIVGGIFAGYAVFWWLTVLQVDNQTEFESIFFGPNFMAITIIAPCLVFLGSLLSDFSRELGQLFAGLASGIMFVLAVLYTFEPAIMGLAGDLEMSDALWMTARLAILCGTVLFAAKLFIDAWLLVWVKKFMESNPGIDYSISDDVLESEINVVSESEA